MLASCVTLRYYSKKAWILLDCGSARQGGRDKRWWSCAVSAVSCGFSTVHVRPHTNCRCYRQTPPVPRPLRVETRGSLPAPPRVFLELQLYGGAITPPQSDQSVIGKIFPITRLPDCRLPNWQSVIGLPTGLPDCRLPRKAFGNPIARLERLDRTDYPIADYPTANR